jgi:hypothetical protein
VRRGWARSAAGSSAATYKVTFAPNPNRKHTRGKRGFQSIAPEQVDFELEREAEDFYSLKRTSILKERQKRESADNKAFALRGYKGKGHQALSGVQREQAMKETARINRIRSGTEGVSRAERKFREEEGFAVSHRPKQPWNAPRPRAKKNNTTAQVKPFDLKSAVAKFKRTGALPDVTAEYVRDLPSDGIDGKTLRRMIQALLQRGNVEINPGPDDCVNCGLKVAGEIVKLRGRSVLKCPLCSQTLARLGTGKTGLHPDQNGHIPVQEERRFKITRPPAPLPSAPLLQEESTSTTPVLKEKEKAAPSIHLVQEFVDVKAGAVPDRPTPHPPKRPDTPVLPPTPPTSPAFRPSSPRQDKHSNVPPSILKGHDATRGDLEMAFELAGYSVSRYDIEFEQKVLPYTGEKRLAQNRNVVEIKAGMDIVQATVSVPTRPPNKHRFILALGLTTLLLLLFAGIWFCLPVIKPEQKVSWRNTNPHRCLRIVCNPRQSSIDSAPRTNHSSLWLTIPYWLCLLALLPLPTVLLYRKTQFSTKYITYLPHLVSAVVSEYDRGTNAEAVNSTIRQRIRRLACLPIPDEDALVLINGSELVAKAVISRQNFFGEGAACFRRLP